MAADALPPAPGALLRTVASSASDRWLENASYPAMAAIWCSGDGIHARPSQIDIDDLDGTWRR